MLRSWEIGLSAQPAYLGLRNIQEATNSSGFAFIPLILHDSNEEQKRFSCFGKGILLTPVNCWRDASLLLEEPRKMVLLDEPCAQTDLAHRKFSAP